MVDHARLDQKHQPPPPADPTSMVATVSNVDKRFGKVQALQRLNIDVPKAKITVLLGPNGAGKTTAIRMITGAMTPDSGSVRVFGGDPSTADGEDIRRRCGVVSAKPSLYERLSGRDNLRYAAELYDLGRGSAVDARILEAAAQFGIDDALEQQVGGYSTGMKTRLALARSILHEPDLLLLDEPTSGLDPESAQSVLAMVREMTGRGRTVLLCTHLLLEAEGLADEMVVVQDGTTLMWGDPNELSRRYWPNPEVEITAEGDTDLTAVQSMPGVIDLARSNAGVRVVVESEAVIGDVIQRLARDGVSIRSVVPFKPSLEDLYFSIRREYRIDRKAASGDPLWERARNAAVAANGLANGSPATGSDDQTDEPDNSDPALQDDAEPLPGDHADVAPSGAGANR